MQQKTLSLKAVLIKTGYTQDDKYFYDKESNDNFEQILKEQQSKAHNQKKM